MTADPLALVAAMPMPEPLAEAMCVPAHAAYTANQYRAARLEAAQLVLAQGGDALHAAIMNIQQRLDVAIEHPTQYEAAAYAKGHRDARHAAAELALGSAVLAQGEPVAWAGLSEEQAKLLRAYAAAHCDWVISGHASAEAYAALAKSCFIDSLSIATPAAPVNAEVLAALKSEALSIFNNPPSETPQDVRDVIEWYDAVLNVLVAATKGQ